MEKLRILLFFTVLATLLGSTSCTPQMDEGGSKPMEENSGKGVNTDPKPAPKPEIPDEPCHYNGHQLHVGPKGGCYYFYDGRKKEYVDHSFCKDCEKEKKAK
jgi:hypothetical protein